jgi:hypothetical protein
MMVRGCLVLGLLGVGLLACGQPASSPSPHGASAANATGSASSSSAASPASTSPEGGGRLTAAQLAALGPVADSPCRAHKIPPEVKAGACRVVGPLQGAITGTKGEATPGYDAALEACVAAPGCIGVSSDWYGGASPWYPVLGASGFAVDSASYACTLLLDCNPK